MRLFQSGDLNRDSGLIRVPPKSPRSIHAEPKARLNRKIFAQETQIVQREDPEPTTALSRVPATGTESEVSNNWYTVQSGDTLSIIAGKVYGDISKWPRIFESNLDRIEDPDLIEIGWRLFIPPLDTAASLAEQAQKGIDEVKKNLGFSGTCRFDPQDWEPIELENFRLKPGRSASEAINRIFSIGTQIDCACALWASFAYSVLNTVGPDRFDRAMGEANQNNQNLVIGKRVALADEGLLKEFVDVIEAETIDDLLPGDAVYFKNTEDIHKKHPESPWQGENTIYRGNGQFSGHGLPTGDADSIIKELVKAYNKPPTAAEKAHPDYDPSYEKHKVDESEIPGIQWHRVLRLHKETVELL